MIAEPISVPEGFSVTRLAQIAVEPEQFEYFTISLDADAPGDFGGEVVFVTNDPDERFFSFYVSGSVTQGNVQRRIDNGDDGFASLGDWTHTTYLGQGFDGDVHFSAAGDGSDFATWTFPTLGAGTYRVAATWSPHENRASNSPFRINGRTPVLINQKIAPDDFTADGVSWEVLDNVTITDNTIVVTLTDDADGFVVADAVRVDIVSNARLSVQSDDVEIVEGVGYVDFGIANQFTSRTREFTISNPGSEPMTLYGPIETPEAFTASPLDELVLAPGQSTSISLSLDTSQPGAYRGTVSFGTSDVNENPFTFTVTGAVIEPTFVATLDDGDVGFATIGEWFPYNGQGANNDVTFAAAGNGSNTARWTFDLPSPGLYSVSATWSTHRNRATDAPYSVNGSTPVLVNQELTPADFTEAGIAWEHLGDFEIDGTTLTVTLSNSANEYVIADAIRIQQITTPSAQIIDNGGLGFTTTGNWTHYIGQGRAGDVHFAESGAGGAAATWNFTVPIPGQYRVSASWSIHANRATNAPYTITTDAESITIPVDQEQSPNDFLAAGTAWEDLAIIDVPGNTLAVQLTNLANDYVIADAIRVEYAGPLNAPAPIFHGNTLPQPTYSAANVWQNPLDRYDVDDNGWAQALDVLILVNEINAHNFTQPDRQLPPTRPADFRLPYLDITGDNAVTALDAIALINRLNHPALAKTEFEDSQPIALREEDVDAFFRTLSPYSSS